MTEPEDFRIRGWSHPTWEDLEHQVAEYKAVPVEKLGVVVRSLFRNGAKKVVVEDEESWVDAEREVEEHV